MYSEFEGMLPPNNGVIEMKEGKEREAESFWCHVQWWCMLHGPWKLRGQLKLFHASYSEVDDEKISPMRRKIHVRKEVA